MRTMLTHTLALALTIAALGATAPFAAPAEAQGARRAPAARGWLGFTFSVAGNDRSSRVVVIEQVLPGSPAEKAGLQPGDTISEVNGRRASPEQFDSLRRALSPGDAVRLRARREGRTRDVRIVAGRRAPYAVVAPRAEGHIAPDSIRRMLRILLDSAAIQMDSVIWLDSLPRFREEFRRMPPDLRIFRGQLSPDSLRILIDSLQFEFEPGVRFFSSFGRAVAGAEFTDLNPQLAEYFQGAREGALVVQVAPSTPAAEAGLRPGDVVTSVDGKTIRSVRELRDAIRGSSDDRPRLDVVRKGRTTSLRLPR